MKKVKILFTDIHSPTYYDKNPFREGFEWGKKVILDLCVEVDLDVVFNNYIDQPELRVRNGRVVKFGEYVIEYMIEEQKKRKQTVKDQEDVSHSAESKQI